MSHQSITIDTNSGSVSIGDNGYGDVYIILKGPRGEEREDDLISIEDAKDLRDFLIQWLPKKEEPHEPKP